jgi:hypothetical protein
MPVKKIFFAYPSTLPEVMQATRGAGRLVAARGQDIELHLWIENDIAGRPLTDPIFEQINQCDILFADVTTVNFNVTFEIGYAIGLGKRIYITRNANFRRETELIDRIGIFDTLGFEPYSNEEDLAGTLIGASSGDAIRLGSVLNAKAPIYVLNTPTTGQAMLAIVSRIKKARLGFRNFFPQEEPRLSAIKAVDDISASLGVVVPLLSKNFADAHIHNIRAAFVAGVALALGKATVILQPSDGPAPLDVRDIVKTYTRSEDIADQIGELALDVTERLQAVEPLPIPAGNFLAQLSLGDPIAENEFQTLGNYFLRTDEFGRASRGEVNIVLGRKGAGKTALFSQLRNEKRENSQNIVVDLKPEGYQLIRLKEDVPVIC